jgi:hypothetical protein
MLQNFEVLTPLFEDQVNERFQFKVSVDGNEYQGIFQDDEVQWFQPQPTNIIEEDEVTFIEANIQNLIYDRLLQ